MLAAVTTTELRLTKFDTGAFRLLGDSGGAEGLPGDPEGSVDMESVFFFLPLAGGCSFLEC